MAQERVGREGTRYAFAKFAERKGARGSACDPVLHARWSFSPLDGSTERLLQHNNECLPSEPVILLLELKQLYEQIANGLRKGARARRRRLLEFRLCRSSLHSRRQSFQIGRPSRTSNDARSGSQATRDDLEHGRAEEEIVNSLRDARDALEQALDEALPAERAVRFCGRAGRGLSGGYGSV